MAVLAAVRPARTCALRRLCRRTLAIGALGLAACHSDRKLSAPSALTVALPAPAQTEPAFEPHVTLDAAHPRRLVVSAQYGVGYNHGGKRIWEWSSPDGGQQWAGGDVA